MSTQLSISKIALINLDQEAAEKASVYVGQVKEVAEVQDSKMSYGDLVQYVNEFAILIEGLDFGNLQSDVDLAFLKGELRNINANLNFYVFG